MNNTTNPTSLFNQIKELDHPDISKWDPPYCGEIDICIHKNGDWSFNGTLIGRKRLVKLFSKIILRKHNFYYLITPVEKLQIKVEAEVFITTNVKITAEKDLVFTTNLGDSVTAGKNNPINVSNDNDGNPYPVLLIRDNLYALISRQDYYQLIDWSISERCSTSPDGESHLCYITSQNEKFILGYY